MRYFARRDTAGRPDIMTSTRERIAHERRSSVFHDHRSAIMDGNANTRGRGTSSPALRPQKFADGNDLRASRGVSGVSVRCISSVPNCSNFTSDFVAVRCLELRNYRPFHSSEITYHCWKMINFQNKYRYLNVQSETACNDKLIFYCRIFYYEKKN